MTPTAKTQDACMTASPLPASAGPDSSLTGTYLNQFNRPFNCEVQQTG